MPPTMTTPTPISNSGPWKKRHVEGSRRRANKRGRVRGIVIRPDEMLVLIRTVNRNAPIPPDAEFFGMSVNDDTNMLGFHFYSVANPNVNCVQMTPSYLLGLVQKCSNGVIPKDAEVTGICVHDSFTLVRLDVVGNFPTINQYKFPVVPFINFRYDGDTVLITYPNEQGQQLEKRFQLTA